MSLHRPALVLDPGTIAALVVGVLVAIWCLACLAALIYRRRLER